MDISVLQRFVEEFDCRCMCNLQTGVLRAYIWKDLFGLVKKFKINNFYEVNLLKFGQNLKVTDCILANLYIFLLSIIRLHSMMKKEK